MKSVFLYTIFYATIIIVSSRKVYNVEEEALNLYGEDLHSVLLRFRKSPDYLNILQDKVKGMTEELEYMMLQIQEYSINELNAKILQTLGVKTSPIQSDALRSKFHRQYPFYSPLHVKTRRDDLEKEIPAVSRLDHYPKLHQAFTTANYNYFKAMGFEYAGRTIHTLIKHMGPDDTPVQSTQQPYEDVDKNVVTTTEHDHDHQVKPSEGADITAPDLPEVATEETTEEQATSPTDGLRFSFKNKRVSRKTHT